jgi:hypothetical protein
MAHLFCFDMLGVDEQQGSHAIKGAHDELFPGIDKPNFTRFSFSTIDNLGHNKQRAQGIDHVVFV